MTTATNHSGTADHEGVTQRCREADRRVPTSPPPADDPCHRDDQQHEVDGEQRPRARRDVGPWQAAVPITRSLTPIRRAESRAASPHRSRDAGDADQGEKDGRQPAGDAREPWCRDDRRRHRRRAGEPRCGGRRSPADVGSAGRRPAPTTVSTPAAPIQIHDVHETPRRAAIQRTATVRMPIEIASPETRIRSVVVSYKLNSTGRRLSHPSQIEAASAAHETATASAFTPLLEMWPGGCWRGSSCRHRVDS